MKKLPILSVLVLFIFSCAGIKNTSNSTFVKRIQRVTPSDIKSHTNKIIIDEYQYQLEESEETGASIYLETSWKDVDVLKDEKAKNFNNVRVRFRIRSRETRKGPKSKYNVHSLKLTAEVEAYKQTSNDSSNWIRAEVTPMRREYLENIYSDLKLEFDSGVMNFN